MNISLILNNESFDHSYNKGTPPLYSLLIDLQEIKETLSEQKEKIYKNDRIYYIQLIEGIEIYKLLYFDESIIPTEEKRLLTKIIEHNSTLDDELYDFYSNEIKTAASREPFGLLCCFLDEKLPLHVNSADSLLELRRHYLNQLSNPEHYLDACSRCFPNLYFHPNVIDSIKTLSATLEKFRYELTRHLSAINDVFYPLFNEDRSQGAHRVLELLSTTSNLSCSMEGNAESARNRLSFNFRTDCTEASEITLVCEPHTKLESTNLPGDTEYRYDRIYFHPGRADILGGKVLIAHIGRHL